MALPNALQVGLKEWASVCQALEAGRQMVLLRKGGIFEAAGGFEVENREFLMFPTYLHQNLQMLKDVAHGDFEYHAAEPSRVKLSAAGVVTDIIQINSRAQVDAIDDEHVWTAPLIDMRFNYRPKNPLYLLLVRAYRLARPVMIDNTAAYAGCKSWVPLDDPVSTAGAAPVMGEGEYEARRRGIVQRLGAAAGRGEMHKA